MSDKNYGVSDDGRYKRLISIFRQMNEFGRSYQALLKALLGEIPKAALPANPELFAECKQDLERVTEALDAGTGEKAIEDAAKTAVRQLDRICKSNQAALEERDAAVKEVVATVASAVKELQGHGENHTSNLGKFVEGFEALAHLEDVGELRRRLRDEAGRLRESVEAMHRESGESLRLFETRIQDVEQRLEAARLDCGADRLTGLGSRREAERRLQKLVSSPDQASVALFEIRGFREINSRQGNQVGDQLLQSVAALLRGKFRGQGVFRWAPTEFLVVAEGSPSRWVDVCRDVAWSFSSGKLVALQGSRKVTLMADVGYGIALYTRGEAIDQVCRRAKEFCEESRKEAHA